MTASNSKSRDAALARLATTLGDEPGLADVVAPLDARSLDRLDTLLTAALQRDDARVSAAVDETVRFVPRPLRGRARKMLFPDGSG